MEEKRTGLIFYALATVFSILLLTELSVRIYFHIAGYHVGSLAPGWQQIKRVDSLVVEHAFYTDSSGIFKADSVYWAAKGMKINSFGFRGGDFVPDSSANSLLLLGDSFAWGAEAKPVDSSFADILSREGFRVYNTGIPGADPAQYALIADSFMAKLHPKNTAVMFYLGNDLMDEPRKPEPDHSLFYVTNTGWLPGYYNGQYFSSATESYLYYLNLYTPRSEFAQLVSSTALGTLLLSLPLRLDERRQWQERRLKTVSHAYLQHILKVCNENGSQLLLFVIPYNGTDLTEAFAQDPQGYILKEYASTFKGLETKTYVLPMRKNDYLPLPNGHFNNRGHKHAAEFMQRVLDAKH